MQVGRFQGWQRSVTLEASFIARLTGGSRGGRFASIEGYRGLAAVSVLVFHVWLVTWPHTPSLADAVMSNLGNFGVAVFFVISGFVLFRPACRSAFDGSPMPGSAAFLLRRFLRIYPAYWLAITGWALAADPARRAAVSPIKVFLLIDADEGSLGLAWTLRLEVMFYIFLAALMPAMSVWFRRVASPKTVLRHLLIGLAALYAAGLGARWWITSSQSTLVRQFHSFVNHLDWFALGMLLAVASAWLDAGGRLPAAVRGLADRAWACWLLSLACHGAVAFTQWVPDGAVPLSMRTAVYVRWFFQGGAAVLLVLPAALGRAEQWSQAVLRRPFTVALGTVSYGVYLWHWVLLMTVMDHLEHTGNIVTLAAQSLMLLFVAFCAATLSHRLVERPAMRLSAELTSATVGWRSSRPRGRAA